MIEKVDITAGSGTPIGADLVSGSYFQYLKLLDGTSGSASPIAGDPTYGLDVDVTRLPALSTGSNVIGQVTLPTDETTGANAKIILRAYDNAAETYVDIALNGGRLPVYIEDSMSIQVSSVSSLPNIADGSIDTIGSKADNRSVATDTTAVSAISLLKEISYMEQNPASRAVTNAGTFSVQSSSLIPGTSASSLGKAEDAVHASGDTGVMGLAVRKNTASALAGADGDYAPLEVDASGRLHVAPLAAGTQKIGTIVLDSGSSLAGRISSSQETSTVYNATTALTPKFFAISASMANSNTLVAGVAGKKIRVTGMAIMSASTVNVKFQSGAAGTDLTGYFPLVANTGFVLPDNPTGWFETTASALLNMFTSASVSLGGCGKYLEV